MKLPLNNSSHALKILYILLGSVLIVLCMHLLLQAVNLNVYHQQHGQFYELSNRFDFDDEASVPTWLSQFLYLCISVMAALAAYLLPKGSTRRLWVIIAVFAFIFSIDEIAGLHEFVLQTLHVIFYSDAGPGTYANAWLLVAPFLIIGSAWFIYSMASSFPRKTLLLLS